MKSAAPTAMYRYKLIGQFEVFLGDHPVALPSSKKTRALLAYLASEPKPVSRDRAISLFFDDVADPRGALRWSLSRLRSVLGKEALMSDKRVIGLSDYPVVSDVADLETLLSSDPEEQALVKLAQLLDGEFLEDLRLPKQLDYESWRLGRVVNTNESLITLHHRLVGLGPGTEQALGAARKLVSINPSDESAWVIQVRTLQSLNRMDEARKVQQLAIAQLEKEGVTLTGDLSALWPAEADRSTGPGGVVFDIANLRPRVVVLPTRSPKAHKELGREMTEMLFRACSVNKTLTVVAPAMAERAKDDYASIGNLVLQSALSKRQSSLLLTAELADANSGEVLTSWRFSTAITPRNQVDRAEAFFCARFEIDLPIALVSRVHDQPEARRSALDDYLLALPRMFTADGFDPEGAYAYLESALSKKPHFGLASCALAMIRNFMPQHNDDDDEIELTLSFARRAIEMSQDDAFVLGIASMVVGHQAHDIDTGLHLARRGLSINPFSIMAGVAAAMISHYGGDDDSAWAFLDDVESHSETDPVTFFVWTCRAMICYQRKDYPQALDWAQKAVGQNPRFIIGLRYLLASLGQLDMVEEGRALAEQLQSYDATETIDYFQRRSAYANQAAIDHLCEGLLRAGLS
ncbi:MAG: hypothetical protein AAF541_09045 [Pseudomonadota bacterium]